MRFIDAHCHLSDPRLDSVRAAVIDRAKQRRIDAFVQGGIAPEEWDLQLKLVGEYEGAIFPVFGLHPWWVADHDELECETALGKLPSYLPKAVGLGELGLDFGKKAPRETWERQHTYFEKQATLARGLGMPLVLHVVKAHAEALATLRRIGVPRTGGIVHSFSGDPGQAQAYLELGLLISVGGPVTRKGFERIKQAVVAVPLENLVIETDAPDQPTSRFEGKLNEPVALWEVAEAVGRLKKAEPERILAQSRENLIRIFRLPA